jgi:hypothetical protein
MEPSSQPPLLRLTLDLSAHLELPNSAAGSESESYITTNGQSASLSLNKSPIWGLRSNFYYSQTFTDLLMWGVLSEERTGLSFTIAPGPRQHGCLCTFILCVGGGLATA